MTVGPPFYERATAPLFAALMLLMGIAPLSAWGHSTVKTLGRAIWKPALLALAMTALIYLHLHKEPDRADRFLPRGPGAHSSRSSNSGAPARARQKAQNENFFTAFARLTGRNRRRYGGYIIHISMMLMAVGILGIEIFQKETQGTVPVNRLTFSRRL